MVGSSWFNFGGFDVSQNASISFSFLNLLVFKVFPNDFLHFSSVSEQSFPVYV